MKKIVHTLAAGIRFVALAALLAACKEDDAPVRFQEVTPAFAWEDSSFRLDVDNGWCLTRFKDHVALTNFSLQCQILLSWNGNLAAGEKTDAYLRLAEVGKPLQTLRLDELRVENIDGRYYSLQFRKEGSEGSLTFVQ